MKLIVLHGTGLVGISNYITNFKKKFTSLEVLEINAKNIDLSTLISTISTPQLFFSERLIILENLSENSDLKTLPKDQDLTILVRLNKQLLKSSSLWKSAQMESAQIIEFSEEKEASIFPFLDLVIEGSLKSQVMLDQLLKEFGSQYILTMLAYMLRRLILTPKTTSSFVLKKLQKQKENLSLRKINLHYREILTTDFKIKSGVLDEKTALLSLLARFIF
ncbi:hypothetical protein HY025_03425 [Candidatus Daviesbacteria bacterium]|nr:hypothetical protein [Candidatus Daviesbacteria bacterium]